MSGPMKMSMWANADEMGFEISGYFEHEVDPPTTIEYEVGGEVRKFRVLSHEWHATGLSLKVEAMDD